MLTEHKICRQELSKIDRSGHTGRFRELLGKRSNDEIKIKTECDARAGDIYSTHLVRCSHF